MISLMFLWGNKPEVRVLLTRCTRLRSQTFASNPFPGHWLGSFMRLSLGPASQRPWQRVREREGPCDCQLCHSSRAPHRRRLRVTPRRGRSCPMRWRLCQLRVHLRVPEEVGERLLDVERCCSCVCFSFFPLAVVWHWQRGRSEELWSLLWLPEPGGWGGRA